MQGLNCKNINQTMTKLKQINQILIQLIEFVTISQRMQNRHSNSKLLVTKLQIK